MKKRILSVLCALCMMLSLLPVTAFAAATDAEVTETTYYASGALKSLTTKFSWDTGSATSRLVLMTQKLASGQLTDLGSYGNSFSNFSEVEAEDAANDTFGIISDSAEQDLTMGTTPTMTINFTEGQMPLGVNKTYYVYQWTYWSNNYYPDALICVIRVQDGAVQFSTDGSAFVGLENEVSWDVTVTPAANMTKTSGTESQTNLKGAMTPVVYTANSGYEFPADYAVTPANGIMVRRDSATQITVLGTPTANAAITLPPPTPTGTTYTYAYDAQRSPSFPASVGAEITANSFNQPLKSGSASPNAIKYASSEGTWILTEVGYYADKSSFNPVPTDYLDGVVNAVANKYSLDTDGKNGLVIHKLTDADGTHVGYGVVIAVDETNGYTLFIGDLWNNSGAGYLLSKNAISATSVTFNAQQMAQSKYSISLSPTTVTFAEVQEDYNALDAQTITVANTGNDATGALSVTLSGTNASSFTLSNSNITDIAVSGSDTFTVVPNTGLAAGTYTATVTVNGNKVMPETVTVSFTVNAPTTYNVAFVGGEGATGSAPTQAATAAGGKFNLPNNPFTKTGYTFAGWNDGTNTYAANAEYTMPAKAVTFTAQWTADTYTVTFNANGGTGTMGNQTYTYGVEQALTANAFSKTGHTFAGWATSADGNVTYTNSQSISLTANTELFAKWTVDNYTVNLNAQGGTIADGKNVTGYTYGTPVTLPGVADMTNTGYTFGGWYTDSSFTGDAVTAITATDTGDKTFYAKWTPDTYIVTFNANGGTGTMADQTYTYGVEQALTANAFTHGSYTFAGWATSANGEVVYTNSQSISLAAGADLYAKWTLNSDAELEDVTFTHAYDVQRSPAFPARGETITLRGFQYPLDAESNRGTTHEGSWVLSEVGTYYSIKNTDKNSDYLLDVVNGVAGNYTDITADEIIIHELKNGSDHVAYGVVVAYDATSGRAVFLGDTWNGGAGYLLAIGTQTDPASVTASAVATDFVQAADYRITLDKTGTYTFTAATVGYAAQSPVTITVTNAGSAATGDLTVALSGTNADSFALSKSSITEIAVSGSDTFTVVPNTGLAAGIYTATVTVSGTNNVVPKSFNVSFTVNAITVTFDANGGTVTPTSNTTGADGKLASLPTPTRSGSYSFKGWYTAANGGTQVTTDTVFTENTTIFAQWTYTGGSYYPTTYAVVVEDADNGEVSASTTAASKGTTVTIQVAPDKGYTLETLTATDRSGKEIELTKVSDGKYTFKMPASKVTVQATFMEDNTMLNFFVDVSADAYYYDAVLWAAKNGITEGTSATTFNPNMDCTRAQMVTFLWRAVGSPEPTANVCPFTDVELDSYYGKAVLWAVENGITKGTSATTFSPDMACSRAQMVTFICRMANGKPVSSIIAFTDVPADAYYAESVQWAVENGITNGTGDNKFSPDATCTRAQMVTFLYRHFGD